MLNMQSLRTHCVRIDIKSSYPEETCPNKEWVTFISEDLNLKFEDWRGAYICPITQSLILTLANEETYDSTVEKLAAGVPWKKYQNCLVFGQPMSMKLTPVSVTGLPVDFNLKQIDQILEKHGRIMSSKLGYLKDTNYKKPDGTYNLRMSLKPGTVLPSVIDFPTFKETFLVFSENSKRVCLRCTRVGHIARFCRFPARKPEPGNISWARIVQEGVTVKNPTCLSPRRD